MAPFNFEEECIMEKHAIENKLDAIITHLSSINYILLYGERIDKDKHFEELNRRLNKITQSKQELLESDQTVSV